MRWRQPGAERLFEWQLDSWLPGTAGGKAERWGIKSWLICDLASRNRPIMSVRLPDCPHLPMPRAHMDWRDVSGHGENRDADFYATVLEYGHFLWRRGQSARAILC